MAKIQNADISIYVYTYLSIHTHVYVFFFFKKLFIFNWKITAQHCVGFSHMHTHTDTT